MNRSLSVLSRFNGLRIAITGAKGSLGKSLTKELKNKGAYVVGLTHTKKNNSISLESDPNEWIIWTCGKEELLSKKLFDFDILILNHGFNPKGLIDSPNINKAMEINTISHWRLIQIFEDLALKKYDHNQENYRPKEIWINTSEAEIQIAFSPLYEMTKRVIGEIVSLKKSNSLFEDSESLIIKKLVLGPFKSKLNPQGIMTSDFVSKQIIKIAETKKYLIIVSPNPFTYLLMPIIEVIRIVYSIIVNKIYS